MLKLLMTIGITLSATVVSAKVPVHSCTFYHSVWKPFFMGCAEPKIHRRTCTIVKGPCPACIKYQGDRGSMFLPDYLIEVTEHYGDSIFKHTSPGMKSHLDLAKSYYESKTMGVAHKSLDKGGRSPFSNSYFWHARMLVVPYGPGALTYMSLRPGGGPLPICFSGISEFFFDQWHLGISDGPFAAAWAPVGIPMCLSDAGAAANAAVATAIANAKSWGGSLMGSIGAGGSFPMPGLQQGCAYPVNAKAGLGMNLNPSSDALSFPKLCMGSLGNLVPREGTITTEDRFRSAVMAAWKFASLVKDFHPSSMAGIEFDYKWQLVYPQTSHGHCFRPGTLEDFPTGPVEFGRDLVAPPGSEKTNTYVFAIWRKRETHCMEPEVESVPWRKSIDLEHKALETACNTVTR